MAVDGHLAQPYASLMPLSIGPATGTIIIEGGRDDDQAGIRIRQAGDAFDRYAITPDGTILTGDGTAAPAGAPYAVFKVNNLPMEDVNGTFTTVLYDETIVAHPNFTLDVLDGSSVTVTASGIYAITANASFSGWVSGDTTGLGVEVGGGATFFSEAEGEATKQNVSAIWPIDAGDNVNLYARADGDASLLSYGYLSLVKVA